MHNNRRDFIKKSAFVAGSAGLIAPNFSFHIPKKNVQQDTIGHGNFKYKVNKEWGVQDPAKVPVKDCHEMVQDKQGRLILFTNETKNNLIYYDQSGKVLKTAGTDFPGAHGLTLSEEGGEEFLYMTDFERHQVFKADINGNVLMTLDFPKESGVYVKPEEYKPTETAIAPNGDIYVTDGYGLNYIIQYNSKGEYIRHFGGKGDAAHQFDCCHGITVDTRGGKAPTLLVSARTMNELKRFDMEGNLIERIPLPGCWICRPVIKGDNIYFAVIVTNSWWEYDGMVAVLDKDNKIVSLPGGSAPAYENNNLQKPSSDYSTFLNPHDVCVDQDENIYVPQWYSGRTYPIKLERV